MTIVHDVSDGIITDSQVRRLNALVADMLREGTLIPSAAGSLIGTAVELLMAAGATDEQISDWVGKLLVEIIPLVRDGVGKALS